MKKGKPIKVTSSKCPHCKGILNGAECINGDFTPQEGDITICGHCSKILKFNKDLQLEKISNEELENYISKEDLDLLNEVRTDILIS